jgi:hypothetical protein
MSKKNSEKKKSAFRAVLKGIGATIAFIVAAVAVLTTIVVLVQDAEIKKIVSARVEPFEASLFTTNFKVENAEAGTLGLYVLNDLHIDVGAKHSDGQIDFAETDAIVSATVERIKNDDTIQNVILPGDLTNRGDNASLERLYELLSDLEEAGKNVYPLPATHDFEENRDEVVTACMAFSLRTGNVIERSPFDNGYSYVVQMAPGYRMLVVNADYIFRRGYTDEELDWVLEQIKASRESGNYIFSMQHYPLLLPGAMYDYTGSKDWHEWHLDSADKMADAGLELTFCGHSHVHSIVDRKTQKGNTIYSVTTGPTAGSPGVFRRVEISYDSIDIKTLSLTADEMKSAGIDTGGKNASEYMRAHFGQLMLDAVHSAATDMDAFAEHCGDLQIGLSSEKVKNDKTLYNAINVAGKLLDTAKIKDVKNFLLYTGKIGDEFGERYFKDFIVELVTGITYGGMNYTPGSDEYEFTVMLTERLKPIIKLVDSSGKTVELVEKLRDAILYKSGPNDWNLTLPRLN